MLTLCHNYFRVLPNNKNSKDGPNVLDKRKYAFGILVLLFVVILWVLSSEVTKYIYQEKKIERPFLITYIRSSLLFIYLIVLCFTPPTKDPCRPTDYTQLLEQSPETDDENFSNDINNSLSDSTFVPVRAGETTDSDDATPRAVRFNKVAEVRVMSAAMAGEALLARLSWTASVRATEHANRRAAAAATTRHLRAALHISAPWFLSHYLFRLSLLHTSASSATLVTASASAFSVALGAILAQTASDKMTPGKCVAIVCTVGGLLTLGLSEGYPVQWTGGLAALGSALCYTTHLLVFCREMRKGDGINAPLLVGLTGGVCAGAGWALGGALAAAGAESARVPAAEGAPALVADAALGPLLLDSLWLWGQSLTSSQTATAMLALAPPLSAVVDCWRGVGGAWRMLAAALAGLGWLLAVLDLPSVSPITWFTKKLRAAEGFSAIRNLPDLDEQSEALISAEEPT